jgi:hypothetical protein
MAHVLGNFWKAFTTIELIVLFIAIKPSHPQVWVDAYYY